MGLLANWTFVNNAKLTSIIRTLADTLENNQRLTFLARCAVTDVASNSEIFTRFKDTSSAAEIIGLDQKAPVRGAAVMEFINTNFAKIKKGTHMDENTWVRINDLVNSGSGQVSDFFRQWLFNQQRTLLNDVRQRINQMIAAMHIDYMNYSRLDIDMRNVSWGMPAGLKPVASVSWDDANNSTPITNMQTLINEIAPNQFGEMYNRITMSTRAYNFLVNSAEFRNRYSGEVRFAFTSGQVNTANPSMLRQAIAAILGVDEVEVTNESYREENADGTNVRKNYLPDNKVLFSNTADDKNEAAYDFANGFVPEATSGAFMGEEGFGTNQRGPISYMTAPEDMNPPTVTLWAAAYGFPRKKRDTCTAVLTVGDPTAPSSPWVG